MASQLLNQHTNFIMQRYLCTFLLFLHLAMGVLVFVIELIHLQDSPCSYIVTSQHYISKNYWYLYLEAIFACCMGITSILDAFQCVKVVAAFGTFGHHICTRNRCPCTTTLSWISYPNSNYIAIVIMHNYCCSRDAPYILILL